MQAILTGKVHVRIHGHVDEDRRGFAALGLSVLVVAVPEQVLVGPVGGQAIVGDVPGAAELGLAPLLVRPHLEVVEAYRGAPVASRLPEVVLVLAEVHLLDNGRQSIQTRQDKNVLVSF